MTTIKDVAKACGVSTATVSYVLNGKRVLLPETREKVLRAIRELDYHPSAVARGLTHKRMKTLGVLFGAIETPVVITHSYTSSILQGILTNASETGYNVTIFTDLWRTAEQSAASYRDQRADGVIVIAPPLHSDIIPGLAAIGLPLVAVSYPGQAHGVPSVDTDNAHGIRLAVSHLRQKGHRRIAHLSGPSDMLSGAARREAFHAVMAEEGLPVSPDYEGPESFDTTASYAQTKRLLALPDPPTALVAASDTSVLGALAAARDLGILVPVRLSLVSFDDTPRSALVHPALTTIREPLTAVGALASHLLRRRLAGETAPLEMHLLEPTLIVRESTAPPIS